MNFSSHTKDTIFKLKFQFQLIVIIQPSHRKNHGCRYGSRECSEKRVKSIQSRGGLVKLPNGGPRHFDRRWATCLGSWELLPWWQSWAGQATGKKGGPPSVKVMAHGCGDWRYQPPSKRCGEEVLSQGEARTLEWKYNIKEPKYCEFYTLVFIEIGFAVTPQFSIWDWISL